MAALAAAIALRTGSLSLLQNLFPIVFVLLFTAPAFFPRDLLHPGSDAADRAVQPADLRRRGDPRGAARQRGARHPAGTACSRRSALLVGATALAVGAMRATGGDAVSAAYAFAAIGGAMWQRSLLEIARVRGALLPTTSRR